MLFYIDDKPVELKVKDRIIFAGYGNLKKIQLMRMYAITLKTIDDLPKHLRFISDWVDKEFTLYKKKPINDNLDYSDRNQLLVDFIESLKDKNRENKIKKLL